jgi:transposase
MGVMEARGAKPHVLFVDRQGNHHYDPAWKRQLVLASFEPGASLSQLAVAHGINTNLLRKWVRKHIEAQAAALSPSQALSSAFIPVRIENAANGIVSRSGSACALDFQVQKSDLMQHADEKAGSLPSVSKLNVSLPNGVKLALECGDVHAITAVVEVLCDVPSVG